jgi:hypothetical protein
MIRRSVAAALLVLTPLVGVTVTASPAGAATPTQCAAARSAWQKAVAAHSNAVRAYMRGRTIEARLREQGNTEAADRLDARLDAAQAKNQQLRQRAAAVKERYEAVC